MIEQMFLGQFQSPGPVMFQVGSFALRWYGFLIASAVIIGLNLCQWLGPKRGINPDLFNDLVIWLVVAAIPSARLYYVLFEWPRYAQDWLNIFAIWQGGIAIHGALIGGSLALLLFSRRHHLSFWNLLDVLTPAVILGQAIGRWGNFFNSEAFGAPTNLPWKLYIPFANRPPDLTSYAYFHPTFLYESLWNLGVFAMLITLFFYGLRHPEKIKTGTVACAYLIGYSLGRVWIEGLRLDSLMFGPLRVAQVVSLALVLLGSIGLFWLYGLGKNLPDWSEQKLAKN
ncbi:prolipoprotein diacylglyceryl transferase [Synechocystis salina]|uniref:Phosphatidylglycerol--prolipoprotein diacylglyceryl transferase n=1 Tax=Synechocystis salina LEGE 00031 TaxID=1828736 RepID=A0ABR9VR55_9SYNC|nr:prolipoprotein diacylglyceryl transferase [Synechocystis salina]MBE9240554.1 prolipoprotein diacylglyceryl transferase [Synechocystis salina LEGE 00041]MBE9253802.1 prolipoprotein diacylglyceryl transferase [Synechocystis salina LEGE 00031]